MALQTSGEISLADIAAEFGGSTPHSLSEYYGVDTVPASGTISFSDFYGTSNAGQVQYTMNGTYTLSAPSSVIHILCIGAGSDGANRNTYDGGSGGGGGGLSYVNNASVTPGETLTIVVPNRAAYGTFGGYCYVQRANGTILCRARSNTSGGYSGLSSAVGTAKYQGGRSYGGTDAGGGGGAAGYAGNGGNGEKTDWWNSPSSSYNFPSTAGSGGGGGGGGGQRYYSGGGGGGVGILGQGSNGAAGSSTAGGGGAGSLGIVGYNGSNGSQSGAGGNGGLAGGGGGGERDGANYGVGNGARGAVRIMWGSGRAWPSTNTQNV